jgi:hypothetical protein
VGGTSYSLACVCVRLRVRLGVSPGVLVPLLPTHGGQSVAAVVVESSRLLQKNEPAMFIGESAACESSALHLVPTVWSCWLRVVLLQEALH